MISEMPPTFYLEDPSLPVQTVIPVVGLQPSHTQKRVEFVSFAPSPTYKVTEHRVPDNLEDMMPSVVAELENRPWFLKFMEDVGRGEKKGVFVVALGALVITSGIAGFEFGVRGGRDVQELWQKVRTFLEERKEKG